MRKLFLILLILGVVSFSHPAHPARADIAPVPNPPGRGISPSGETKVQMVAERVVLDFRAATDNSARVSALFTMHNQGDADEHMQVRFPLNGPSKSRWVGNTFEDYYPLITDFTVWVNNKKLPTTTITDTNSVEVFTGGYPFSLFVWASFSVDFPAGKDVKISVSYTYMPTQSGGSTSKAAYILTTGAGWYGSIGSADIIFRFPYMLNDLNILDEYSRNSLTPTITGNELQWHWDDLEPTKYDNVSIDMVNPTLWQAVLKANSSVIALPDNADSWLALGRAYNSAGVEKHGCFYPEQYKDLTLQAYENAILLEPKNAAIYAEFAQVLYYSDCDSMDHSRAYQELSIALHFDPGNEVALELMNNIKSYGDQNFVLPTYGLTSTRMPPTATVVATSTPIPTSIFPKSLLPPTYTQRPRPSPTRKASATHRTTPTASITRTASVSPSPSSTANPTITLPVPSPTATLSPQHAAVEPVASGPIVVLGLILIVGLIFGAWTSRSGSN